MLFSSSATRLLNGGGRQFLTKSSRRFASASANPVAVVNKKNSAGLMMGTALALTVAYTQSPANNNHYSLLDAKRKISASGDIVSMGMPTKEPATGIQFPQLCNAMTLVGVGVRIKYVFVKVYAVGTYMDPVAMMAVKNSTSTKQIEEALLDPTYPRTIRIVMNRGLAIDKYTAAIVESLEPRMKGQDLDK